MPDAVNSFIGRQCFRRVGALGGLFNIAVREKVAAGKKKLLDGRGVFYPFGGGGRRFGRRRTPSTPGETKPISRRGS